MDKMSFFLNIEFCTKLFSGMKRLLSTLFSVDERIVILDSYVNDIISYIVAKRITGSVCKNMLCFSKYGCFCIMLSQKWVYSHVRNRSTVHKHENKMWTQVEKDINTGVFILRTVDLTMMHVFMRINNHS